jgi:hypothetical protein
MNELLKLAAQLLLQKLGLQLPPETVANAFGQLLGQKATNPAELVSLIGPLLQGGASGGAGALLGGLLGGAAAGAPPAMAPAAITDLFGAGPLGAFAKQLGVGTPQAASGLADILPQLLQQAGGGAGLADAASALGGLLGGGKKLF